MRVTIDENYTATPDNALFGYMGETNSRPVTFNGLTVDGADSYSLVIEYADGTAYEVDITDGTYTPTASVLHRSGRAQCQIHAKRQNGDSYELVKKSNVFGVYIGNSVTDDVAPIPSYEEALSVLDQIKKQANGSTVPVGTAYGWTEGATVTAVVGTAAEYTESEGAE